MGLDRVSIIERRRPMNKKSPLQEAVLTMLKQVVPKEDIPELERTPERVAQTLIDFTKGYREDIDEEIKKGVFKAESHDPVIIRDIQFASLCEHHLLPFFGRATVVFIPDKKLIGLSKIGRIVNHFAARLQVQERMSAQIVDYLNDMINPKACGVVITALHTCMNLRGGNNRSSLFTTMALRGSEDYKKTVIDLLKQYEPKDFM